MFLLVPVHPGCRGQKAVKRLCVCVCVCVCVCYRTYPAVDPAVAVAAAAGFQQPF